MKTVGIILAAGRSNRFGNQDKLLSLLDGKPLCSYAAGAMRASTLKTWIACVTNNEVALEFEGFTIVQVASNQSGSLRAGLTKAIDMDATRILITLADMPLITNKILDDLLALNAPVAACTADGTTKTVPATFSQETFARILELNGDKGARDIFENTPAVATLRVPSKVLFDVDFPTDLEMIQQS